MSDDTQTEEKAIADLRAAIGQPLGAPAVAPDPVNQPMIRHWAAALEDHNPVYTDPEFAKSSRFGGISVSRDAPSISAVAEPRCPRLPSGVSGCSGRTATSVCRRCRSPACRAANPRNA